MSGKADKGLAALDPGNVQGAGVQAVQAVVAAAKAPASGKTKKKKKKKKKSWAEKAFGSITKGIGKLGKAALKGATGGIVDLD